VSEKDSSKLHTQKISHLRQREIQAPVAACLIKRFEEILGRKKAIKEATTAIALDSKKAGSIISKNYKGNTILELGRLMREIWSEDNALTVDILEETSQKLSFNVTRCKYVEMYEKMGIRDLGFCLSCSRDAAFIEGFNPKMKLSRTQTIMEGATYCDFQISLKE
jgi:hypothetical protein